MLILCKCTYTIYPTFYDQECGTLCDEFRIENCILRVVISKDYYVKLKSMPLIQRAGDEFKFESLVLVF